MEKAPEHENKEGLEQQLIKLLKEFKEKGEKEAEVRKLLDIWADKQEELALKENKPASFIDLNLKRARLYFKAGYIEEAFENFKAARMQAWNEERLELYKSIMAEMDELENKLGDQ